MKKQFGLMAIEIMIIVVIVAILVLMVARSGIFPIHVEYSNGERTGVVYKLSKKGLVCKTWEGEMNLGGMATDGNGQAVPNIWRFTAANDDVANKINNYAESGKRVTLEYVEYLSNGICSGKNYVVTSVK